MNTSAADSFGTLRKQTSCYIENTVVPCCIAFYVFDFRHFNLRMKRDTTLFAQDLKLEVSGEEIPYDTSHIYTGEIYGETVLLI